MSGRFRRILIIADIEGSSGCWSRRGSVFVTREWAQACVAMSRDVNAVVQALFDDGVDVIRVQDFHRTGYNLLPELIDSRAEVLQGYRPGPVPGIGDPGDAEAVMFLGMHAASGTDGFLAHTLTSRIADLEMNDKPLAEIQLFAASLAPFGLKPIFFSGCPTACRQAREHIEGLTVYPIDKSVKPPLFDASGWRRGLQQAAVGALSNTQTALYEPAGPIHVTAKLRTGSIEAVKIARRWGLTCRGGRIVIDALDIHEVYLHLIRVCYLTPATETILPIGLGLYRLWGRLGLAWVRHSLRRSKI